MTPMDSFREMGKLLLGLGLLLVLAGALLLAGARLPFRLGRLPGDIFIEGKHSTIYFPIVTCLLLSAAITLLFWVVSHFRR
jgi:hypothetical protein